MLKPYGSFQSQYIFMISILVVVQIVLVIIQDQSHKGLGKYTNFNMKMYVFNRWYSKASHWHSIHKNQRGGMHFQGQKWNGFVSDLYPMYIITDYTKYQLSGSFQVFPSIKKGWRKTRKKNDLKISIIQGTKINIYITILTLTLNFVMFHFVTLTFILVENNTISLINVIV